MRSFDDIDSLQKYLSLIDNLHFQFSSSKNGNDFSYRGMSDSSDPLLPGILRKESEADYAELSYGASEYEILSHFIKESKIYINNVDDKNYLTWLEYAQHFGVPTRLLDFTSNPFVALYFCCKGSLEKDGNVCILNIGSYKNFTSTHSKFILKNKSITTEEMIESIILKIRDESLEAEIYPVHFIPYYIDKRMLAQSSRFLIWGTDTSPFEDFIKDENEMSISSDGIRIGKVNDKRCYLKLRIPEDKKSNILKQLDYCNINDKTLFPGLDGIGKYLKNYYHITKDEFLDLRGY